MDDFTENDIDRYIGILEDEETSDALRDFAEHIVRFYFNAPEETRAHDTATELLKLRSRTSLNHFSEYVFDLVPAAHHREITRILDDPRRKRTLLVFPPGSGKSTIVSLMYPPYALGQNPDLNIISVAASSEMVEKGGSQIRPLMEGEAASGERYKSVFPEVQHDKDAGWTQLKLYLKNKTRPNKDPALYLVGIGSSAILGSRADIILLDDVVSAATARSAAEMKKVTQDMHDVVMTRLQPGGRVIGVMTRFGENDLAPVLVKDFDFEVLHAPALVEDDPRGAWIDFIPSKSYLKEPGPEDKSTVAQWVRHPDPNGWVQQQLEEALAEAKSEGFRAEITKSTAHNDRPCLRKFLHRDNDPVLWPELFSQGALQAKRDQNPVSFRLVYGGDPSGIEGTTFRRAWFKYFGPDSTITTLPTHVRTYMTVDPAVGKSQEKGDYFVVCVVSVDASGNKFVRHVHRERTPTTEQPDVIKDLYRQFPETETIFIETVAYQYALFANLLKANLPVDSIDSKKNKAFKIDASSVFYKQGTVFLPEQASWLETFISEFTSYPTGKHDDQIDAMANLLEWLGLYFVFETDEELEVEFQ